MRLKRAKSTGSNALCAGACLMHKPAEGEDGESQQCADRKRYPPSPLANDFLTEQLLQSNEYQKRAKLTSD